MEEPEKGMVKDSIVSPSGKVIMEKEYEVNLQNYKRNRATRRVLLPPAKEKGIFLFFTQIKEEQKQTWKTVGETPLYVTMERIENKKNV